MHFICRRCTPRHGRESATQTSDGLVGTLIITRHMLCVDDMTSKAPRPALRTQGRRLPDDTRLLHRYMTPQYKLGGTSHTGEQRRGGSRVPGCDHVTGKAMDGGGMGHHHTPFRAPRRPVHAATRLRVWYKPVEARRVSIGGYKRTGSVPAARNCRRRMFDTRLVGGKGGGVKANTRSEPAVGNLQGAIGGVSIAAIAGYIKSSGEEWGESRGWGKNPRTLNQKGDFPITKNPFLAPITASTEDPSPQLGSFVLAFRKPDLSRGVWVEGWLATAVLPFSPFLFCFFW